MKRSDGSYEKGSNSESPLDQNHSLGFRIGYRLARMAASIKHARSSEQTRRNAETQTALAVSIGVNQQALKLIRDAAVLPQPDHKRLDWAFTYDDAKTGRKNYRWLVEFSNPPGQDTNHEVLLIKPLGKFTVDDLRWSHSELEVPMERVTVVATAATDHTGAIQPASTTIWINQSKNTSEHPSTANQGMTGALRIVVNPSGAVALGAEHYGTNGFAAQDSKTLHINAVGLMVSLHAAVLETAQAYRVPSPEEFV